MTPHGFFYVYTEEYWGSSSKRAVLHAKGVAQ